MFAIYVVYICPGHPTDGNRWSENQSINHTLPSDHLPFLGSPGDEIGRTIPTQFSQCKEYSRCKCTWITHLPVITFPCHNVYARHPGRGFTNLRSDVPFFSPLLNIRCIAIIFAILRYRKNQTIVDLVWKVRGTIHRNRLWLSFRTYPKIEQESTKTKMTHRLLLWWQKGMSLLSFAACFIFFRHNWHLHRIFSLYVCDLCFKHD